MSTFVIELTELINRYSLENGSDTPDHILAAYMKRCLDNFDATMKERKEWYAQPAPQTVEPDDA